MPSKNVGKAVKINKTKLIYLFFYLTYVLLTIIILMNIGSKQHINYQFLQFFNFGRSFKTFNFTELFSSVIIMTRDQLVKL